MSVMMLDKISKAGICGSCFWELRGARMMVENGDKGKAGREEFLNGEKMTTGFVK